MRSEFPGSSYRKLFDSKIFSCSVCDGTRAGSFHGRRVPAVDARGGGYRLHHEGVHEAGGEDKRVC